MTNEHDPADQHDPADLFGRAGPPGHASVVIIGCGPVGAMLGNLLGLLGVSTLILERDPSIYPLPRACHLDDEVMRLLQTAGLAEAMRHKVHVSPGMHFRDDAGRLLLDWSRPPDVGPQGWNVSYRFHQPELEAVLRQGLARWPGVTLKTDCEAIEVTDGAAASTVRYRQATGPVRTVQADYVVGCDGARSLVRRAIGSGMEDFGFHERWLVADTILRRPRPDLGDYSVQHCSAVRPTTYVRGTGDRRRWEITLLPGEQAEAMTEPAAVYDLLRRWVTPDDAAIERAAVYTFHSVVAERWRAGRLFLAGDSAHMTPPFLGQGMCAGMRDVANLAWKLARALRHPPSDALLDTYQSERAPHVREYIELAVRLGGLINTRAMESAVPGGNQGEPVRMSTIKPLLGDGLGSGWPAPRGTVAPQPLLRDGTRLDDRVGYGFALLMRPDFAASLSPPVLGRLKAAEVTPVADEALSGWLQACGAEAAMMRPDRYVLGTASDTLELGRLLDVAAPSGAVACRMQTA